MPGILSRGYLIDLFPRLGIDIRHHYNSPNWGEIKSLSQTGQILALFVFQRKPTSHCLLVLELSEDETGHESVTLMKPDFPAVIEKKEVNKLIEESDCDFFLVLK